MAAECCLLLHSSFLCRWRERRKRETTKQRTGEGMEAGAPDISSGSRTCDKLALLFLYVYLLYEQQHVGESM